MINILLPIVDRADEYMKTVLALNGNSNVKFVIGVKSSIASSYDFNLKNAVVKVFPDNAQKEQIINDMQTELDEGGILIARKPFTKEDFQAMTTTEANIVTCAKKKRNKFVLFFRNLWQNLLQLVFGVKVYEGDPSLIYFDDQLSQVLTQVANLSYVSRVDRWKGATQDVAKTTYPPVKLNQDNNFNLVLLIGGLIALNIGVLVTTLVCVFAKRTVLAMIAVALLDVLCVTVFALMIMSFAFNRMVGRKIVKRSGK